MAQPGVDVGAGAWGLLAVHGEALADRGVGREGGVDVDGAPESADGVGDERTSRLPGRSTASRKVLMSSVGARSRSAAEQHRVVAVEGRERVGDRRSGVGVRLADVAGDGLVVAVGVRVSGSIRYASTGMAARIRSATTWVLPTARSMRSPSRSSHRPGSSTPDGPAHPRCGCSKWLEPRSGPP